MNSTELNDCSFEDCVKYHNLDAIEQVASMINGTVFVAHSCKEYSILDIDSDNFNYDSFIADNPYYLSATKKLPHIFYLNETDIVNSVEFYTFGELMYSWAYMSINCNIQNADIPIKSLDYSLIREYKKTFHFQWG